MGELFDRMSRVARAELNAEGEYSDRNYPNEGAALVAGGAISGASVGKIGILAGGTGYSLGTIPLAAVGALSGAALYEVLRSLVENDASSAKAAAIGATGGAATSAVVGGVGVAVGGSAFGVGMASMAAGGAVVGLGLVGLNRLLEQGLDPEHLLERAIDEMKIHANKARQAIINLIVSQKQLQQQYEQAEKEVTRWEERVELALQKGDKFLAGEALKRKKMHAEMLSSLKEPRDRALASVNRAKENLALLEAKIVEARTMRTSLRAKITTLKLKKSSLRAAEEIGSDSATQAFERMEEKVNELEEPWQKFEKLFDAIEKELEEIKQMISSHQSETSTNGVLEESRQTLAPTKSAFSVEEELEELKGAIASHQFDDSADGELEELRQTLASINIPPAVKEELEEL